MYSQFRKLERGEFILVGVDTSVGGMDYTCAQFLSKTRIDVPLVYHSRKLTTEFTNELAPLLERISDLTGITPVVAYERNNGGAFEMDRLAAMNRRGKFDVFRMPTFGQGETEDSPKLGWDTNSATRPKMLGDLKEAIDHDVLKVYDELTLNEMFSFVNVQTTGSWKAQAERGSHDDRVMSLAVAWQLYESVPNRYISETWQEVPKFKPVDDVIGV